MAITATLTIPDKFETLSEAKERRTLNRRFRQSPNGGVLAAVQFTIASVVRFAAKLISTIFVARKRIRTTSEKHAGGRLT
jgi:hypothetical protein